MFHAYVSGTKHHLVDLIDEHHVHRPATDLLSDAHIGLVRRWISSCEAEHEKCCEHYKSAPAQKLPTRLLKIERQNDRVTGVRLIDTSDVEGIYVCLSYCWGTDRQASMTTTANRNEYRRAIPWQELPSTISDAIKLCYRLGYEYLWVDSLCIVQDDDQDWLRESSNMAGIYSRSALTLAVHCDDASESFLQKRLLDTEQWSDGPYGCARVPFTDQITGDKRDMYLWRDKSFKGSRFLDGNWETIKNVWRDGPWGKWFTRAWTFQEWLLSPRVLHIHAMTVWDCWGGNGNELEKRFPRYQYPHTIRSMSGSRSWIDIVQDFTSRQITMDKDRLPALAGLAERYRAETGSDYLAGLWAKDLPERLFWTRSSRWTPMTRPLIYRAPTWSWAALEGEVHFIYFRRYNISQTSKILGHYCHYDPPETFATVKDGWLDIEGPMSVVSGWAMDTEYSSLHKVHLFAHGQLENVQNPQGWRASLDQDQNLEEEIMRSEVHLLDVLAGDDVMGVFEGKREFRRYALVLKSVRRHRTAQDCFQRLGVAHIGHLDSSVPVTDHWPRRTIRLI